MKRFLIIYTTLCLLFLFFSQSLSAQSPEKMVYQAEARDSKGDPIRNEDIEMKITILADAPAPNGTIYWEGYHNVATDNFGMFTLIIGEGTGGTYNFSAIDWANHAHFLNVQTFYKNKWSDMGTTQFLSVPYAFHAKTAENVLVYVDILLERIENLELMVGVEDPVTDIEGNSYQTIRIGTQVWMTKNLKTTKFNDATDIPLVTDNSAWSDLTSPGYCWYDNNEASYGDTYGAIYNWYTVTTGNLCPANWHIPTAEEWSILRDYLGGEHMGGKLKEAGIAHWTSPNTGATNESGFTALPGGARSIDGTFLHIGLFGYWWSSSLDDFDNTLAMLSLLFYDMDRSFNVSNPKESGYAVRCVKD